MANQTEERGVDAPTLPLRGQPLHTRTLVVEVFRDDAHIFAARVTDFAHNAVGSTSAGNFLARRLLSGLFPGVASE